MGAVASSTLEPLGPLDCFTTPLACLTCQTRDSLGEVLGVDRLVPGQRTQQTTSDVKLAVALLEPELVQKSETSPAEQQERGNDPMQAIRPVTS